MKYIAAIAFLTLSMVAAQAQQTAPPPPPQPVTLSGPLAESIYQYLMLGGTHSNGVDLARQLADASQAPAKEAALRKKIEAELKAASTITPPVGKDKLDTEPAPGR